MLEVARDAERATSDKTSRKRRRIQAAVAEIEERGFEVLENVSSNSDSDCIVVRSRNAI